MSTTIQQLFEKVIEDHIKASDDKDIDVHKLRERLYKGALPDVLEVILDRFSQDTPDILKERLEDEAAFVQNNYNRWSPGFELLEIYIGINHQIGESVNTEFRPIAAKNNDFLFEAIITLHARALLVAREIFWLLKGGFADGALGRWRTLHEIAVIVMLLSENEPIVAERYLLHRTVQSYKGLKVYAEYQERADLTPLEDDDLGKAEEAYNEILKKYGEEMRHDWGWAATALNCKKPNFRQIEKHVGMDEWRPRYKWSSQDTHGGYRPIDKMLGTSEMQQPMLLTGPSDSGLTDPVQMMAVSLNTITDVLVSLAPNIDRVIYLKVSEIILEDIVDAFFEVEKQYRKKSQEPERALHH